MVDHKLQRICKIFRQNNIYWESSLNNTKKSEEIMYQHLLQDGYSVLPN